jgi:hypothetical protein
MRRGGPGLGRGGSGLDPRVRLAALAAGGLVLSACSPASDVLGLQPNTSVLSNSPALTPAQASGVAERALTQAETADAARDPALASSAFSEVALSVAAPGYVVEKVLDPRADSGQVLRSAVTPTRLVVTSGRSFPRTLLAVWTPDGSPTAQIAVLRSASVTTPFTVAERADLVAGAVLPATAPNTRGAASLSLDEPGLVATPRAALADLAALLTTGRSSGTSFATSRVVTDVRANAAEQAKGVAGVASFSQEHTPAAGAPQVVRTADGGAIVIGAIDRVDQFTVTAGAGSITPPAAYSALAQGLKKITRAATVRTVQVVVLVVPPAGGGDVRVVGFTEVPVQVSAS